MTAARRHLAALTVGAVLLVSAGCGSDDDKGEPLPGDAVAMLERRLDEVERRFRDGTETNNVGACNDIETDSYTAIDDTVAALPQDVDADVRDALEDGLARLKQLTSEGCSDVEPARTEPEETPPPQPEPPPPVTETLPAPTPTETEPDEKPKDEKKNKDNGKGNGNGNGQPPGAEVPGDTGGATPGLEGD